MSAGALLLVLVALPPPGLDDEAFDLDVAFRARYGYLKDSFRSGADGDDRGLSLRTNVRGAFRWRSLHAVAEIMDARLYAATDATPLNPGLINPFDVLQAYAGWDLEGQSGTLQGRLGRMTMDVGSRRLIARNRYRNTINAFTGVDLRWQMGDSVARVFVNLPVRRRPTDAAALSAHRLEVDREGVDTVFGGLHWARRVVGGRVWLELYTFGLYERDAPGSPTPNRRLVTPGFRVHRPAAAGRVDFEVEGVLQAGRSRASAADRDDLDHLAGFAHLSVGYSPRWPGRLRALFQYDYASGDGDPDDQRNGRFDTLFGARRFEYGPTGLYGAFARSNLHWLGGRVETRPVDDVDGFIAYRSAWLDSATDAWTTTGARDASGQFGRFVGHQVEGRGRWWVWPSHLRVEIGLAHTVFRGFGRSAAGATASTFAYAQITTMLP